MKNTLKLILFLLIFIGIIILYANDYNFRKHITKIKLTDNVDLSKFDYFNLFNFLEEKYSNIVLKKDIKFYEDSNIFKCDNLKFISNNKEYIVNIEFIPLKDNDIITKYNFFNRYGYFKIENVNKNTINVPEINHLSSDNSEDNITNEFNSNSNEFNFNVEDIINSEYTEKEEDVFIKNSNNNTHNINLEDTENDTTESLITKSLKL